MTSADLAAVLCRRTSVPTGLRRSLPSWLSALRLVGPAFVISIGYVDPGNWATDWAAAAYGFGLLWVVVMAGAIAIVLQLAVARLTIASGEDLATMMARRWPKWRLAFWAIGQGAAAAADLAEFAGIVLGLQLLFHWPLAICVALGVAAVMALLALSARTSRGFAYAMAAVIAVLALALSYQILLLHPPAGTIASGALVPRIPSPAAIAIVVGIIGATVMPHNLFLHSSLIAQACRNTGRAERERRGRFFAKETAIALTIATLVNGAILVVAATAHDRTAGGMAAMLAAALLLSGLAASATATLSGDYVFQALAPFHVPVPVRRLCTIAPVAVALLAGAGTTVLLIGSQIALAAMLPVVIIPLLWLTARTQFRGSRTAARRFLAATAAVAAMTIAFDVVMLLQSVFA